MGFFDRLGKIAQGFGDVVTAPIELTIDLANGAFTDAEFDLLDEVLGEGGEALAGLFGPDRGIGAAAGAIPKPLRRGVATPVGKVFQGLETAYREGVAEPVSALMTYASLYDAPGGPGTWEFLTQFPGLNDEATDRWRLAYRTAQERSPGQAIALALDTKDITDPEEVERVMSSPLFTLSSGTADAILRLSNLDPGNALGAAGKIARIRTLNTPVRNIEEAMTSTRVARFVEALDGKSATEIRDQFFPNHEMGGYISTILADAGDTEARRSALRSLMGDGQALADLKARRADLSHQIRQLVSDDAWSWGDGTLFADAGRLAELDQELAALYPQADALTRALQAHGTIREVPRYSRAAELRSTIGRSQTYQQSALTKPLRMFTNRMPQHWVNLNDERGDIQFARQLRRSLLDREEQDAWRARYMAAVNPGDRQAVLIEAETEMVKRLLGKYGVTQADVDKVLEKASQERETALGVLRGRRYDAEGRGSIRFEDADGQMVKIAMPLHITQQADLMPLADLDEVERAAQAATRRGAGRYHAFRVDHPSTDLPEDALDLFYKVWRPSVLLRFGWPQRVLLDEQLRIASEIGMMATVAQWPRGLRQLTDRAMSAAARRVTEAERFGLEAVEARAVDRIADVVPVDTSLTVDGVVFPAAFGDAGDAANRFLDRASARGSMRELVAGERARILGDMRQHTGHFRTILPTEADNYPGAWEWAVNKQIRQSALGRQVLAGADADRVIDWLAHTDEGIDYARQMGWRPHTFRRHAEDAIDQVHRYVPEELRAQAAADDLSFADLARLIDDEAARPAVHGEDLGQALGDTALTRMVKGTVEKAFHGLGVLPTDALSRQPYFAHLYEREVTRLAELSFAEAAKAGQLLGVEDMERIADQARRFALDGTQRLLYDLAEKSELAHAARFIAPFFSAWQEVLFSTWPRQAARNPAFVWKMRQAWVSPERAGLVHDENGNIIDPDGGARNPITGERVEAGAERFITLPFEIPGLPTGGPVSFNKKSMNLILTGSPGLGPVVQVPVNEIVKDRPDLADSLKFVLPFGSTQEVMNLLMPATARRFQQRTDGEDDRVYRNTMIRMYYDRLVDYRLGKRDEPPTYEEVKRDTDALYNLRTVASFVAPFAPVFDSPYKPWIDTYRQAQQRVRDDPDARNGQSMLLADEDGNPRSADEWFYDTFGPEYFPLAQSLSTSKDGVPPTIAGWQAREKYQDLIEETPELGGLIIGAEGAGEFARSVYDNQLANPLRPGSDVNQRESPSFEEAASKPEVAEGWLQFSRAMDLIEAARVAQGLPNLQVKAAQPLALMKRAVISQLAERHPEWYREYSVVDRQAFARRINGMRRIVADQRLQNRPDLDGLATYLQARDLVLSVLAQREATSITATSNRDIAVLWESIIGKIVETNLAFGDLHSRWLSNDPMTLDTLPAQEAV